ncbi:MAG TPA: HAMP domain-containing protein, partial [Gaiellaceae bacterium]
MALAGGGAVFAALAIASLVIYVDVRSNLHDQIDVSLIRSADAAANRWAEAQIPVRKNGVSSIPSEKKAVLLFGKEAPGLFEVAPSLDDVVNGTLPTWIPLIGRDKLVAAGQSPAYFRDVHFGGSMRLYTMRLPSSGNGIVRTARPLTEANATLGHVRWLLVGLTLGGALVAGLLGLLTANAVLRPVRALAVAVRGVSATRDLDRRIPVSGRDELASLAVDFNAMLAALDASQQA